MKLISFLSSLIIVHAATVKDDCDGIYYNKIYHDKEILKEDIDRPYLLTVDYARNTVYFSYSVNKEDDDFRTARLNIITKEFNDIEGIANGFAQTIDRKTNDVYIGGSYGLFKYDYDSNIVEFYGAKGEDVWSIYFKDVVYYSKFPSQFVYTYVDGKSRRFPDLEDTKVDNFLIANDDNIFYTNATGLYSHKLGSKNATVYQEFEVNRVRGMTLDSQGNFYFCTNDGVYAVKRGETSVDKVADIDEVFGIAFDNSNNLIYSDPNSIIRLIPNRNKNCTHSD